MLLGLPVIVLVVLGLFVLTPMIATCGGHAEAVTEALLRCPRATEQLGDDARPARVGLACGSTETSGGSGRASWRMPYAGSRGRGTVSYDAEKRGGDWVLLRAELEAGDEALDLLVCSSAIRPAGAAGIVQTSADAASGELEGKVLRSSHPTIVEGAACTGTLRRERGATAARLAVRCKAGAAEVAIYDGTGAFKLEVGDPSRRDDDRTEYEDGKTREQDETPGCRASTAGSQGTLTIWDTAPAYEIVIAF